MNSRNFVLPESLVPFVADRVARGGYASTEDYVRALIEADQLRDAEDRLEAMVDEAIGSGPTVPVDREFWAERRRKEQDRLEAALLEGIKSGPFLPVTEEYWKEKRRAIAEKYGDGSEPA